MAGISVGGAPYEMDSRDDLNGVLRAALLSAQHLLRERFEKRVAWVDGHWEWRREPAGPGAPPLPAEARKKVADVSRLFEIITNAQFRDRDPPAKPAPEILPFTPAPARRGDEYNYVLLALVLLALVLVWVATILVFHRDGTRRHVKRLKQRINGWFTKKAAANGEAESEQTPPRDDPPPPYSDRSAEPFLPPGGIAGATLTGSGELPPPYSSCDVQPDCKATSSNNQRQSLIDGVGSASAMSETGAANGSMSDGCGVEAGKTDDEGCLKSDSGKAVLCDSSLVLVV